MSHMNSYLSHFFDLASFPHRSFKFIIPCKGLWSVSTVNFLPYRYGYYFLVANTMARSSLSLATQDVCYSYHHGRWDNTNTTNNILRSMEKDFPEDKKKAILDTLTVPKHLFCSDPYWLFRYIKIPLLI